MSVSLLCTMPAARGLFHKAEVQSGAPITATWAATVELAEEVAAAAGAADVAALRTVPLAEVIAAQAAVTQGGVGRMFTPCLDGQVLSDPPLRALSAGSAAGVPRIFGTNVDEWKLFARPTPGAAPSTTTVSAAASRLVACRSVDAVIEAVRGAWAARGEPVEPRDLFFAIESDRTFRVPSLKAADAQSPTRRPSPTSSAGARRPCGAGWAPASGWRSCSVRHPGIG